MRDVANNFIRPVDADRKVAVPKKETPTSVQASGVSGEQLSCLPITGFCPILPSIGSATEEVDASASMADQIARLTQAGHDVIKGSFRDSIVCKFGWTRYCANYIELSAFTLQMGGESCMT